MTHEFSSNSNRYLAVEVNNTYRSSEIEDNVLWTDNNIFMEMNGVKVKTLQRKELPAGHQYAIIGIASELPVEYEYLLQDIRSLSMNPATTLILKIN